MFTIKLTKGQGWEAPVIKEWKIPARSLPDAELFARSWLDEIRQKGGKEVPDGYLILDEQGERLKASDS
jgi:hypothetical protein